MHFNETEIANAVRSRLAQLDANNDLPVILMPVYLELDDERSGERSWPNVAGNGNGRPVD